MWSNNYIGIPYKANGRDKDGLDCWGLVRLIYKEQYNTDLPSFSTEYHIDDNARIKELITQYREGWVQKEKVQEGDLVLFRVLGEETHVGVAVSETHFIHVREGKDTAIESFSNLKWAKRVVGFFRYSEKISGAVLNAAPHPLKTQRIVAIIKPGTTLEEMYHTVQETQKISPELAKTVHIMVNGIPVPREIWSEYKLLETDVVEYRAVPGKEAARIVLTLVVAYIAFQVAPGLAATLAPNAAAGSFTAFATTAVVSAAIATAGMYAINAILPIRGPAEPVDPGSSERQLMVEGGRNSFNPYGAIPVVLGKVRLTPPQGARTYVEYGSDPQTQTVSAESYLKMLLVWGYGPLYIDESTMRIGETPISSYTKIQKVTLDRQTEPTEAQLREFNALYSEDVTQVSVGVELAFQGQSALTSENTVYEPEIPGTGGGVFTTTVALGAESGWVSRVIDKTTQDGVDYGSHRITTSIHFPEGLRRIDTKGSEAGKSQAATVQFQQRIRYSTGVSTWTAWTSLPTISIDEVSKDAITYNFTIYPTDTTKKVEIAIRRITPDLAEEEDARNYYKAFLQTLTAYRPNLRPAIDPPRPVGTKLAKTAIKIQAEENLNGQIEGINSVVQSVCRIWNGTNWNTLAPTSNPAALFLHVLTHPGNPQRIASSEEASKIDFTQLQYWYNYCENYTINTVNTKLEYNSVLGTQRGVLEVLRDICAAGRGSPALVDGKWSVIIDEPRNNIVQHFTPHNSWGFEAVKALPKLPDALKVTFYDETEDYQEKEIIVPAAGYTDNTAELFESISVPGITKQTLAEDFARWHYAQIKLRPEIYTINTDIEYIVCNRGDRVKVTHDVPMWGSGSGRIKNRISQTQFELDEPVYIESQKDYNVRVRGASGQSTLRQIKKTFAVQSYSVSSNEITLNLAEPHSFVVGQQVDINTGTSAINATGASITQVSSTFIKYFKAGTANASLTNITGNISLRTGNFTVINFTGITSTIEADSGDLFLFGELSKESQDLLVLSIEPLGENKSAKLTLVDYGITDTYNIFTGYRSLTGVVYSPNMTLPPVELINSIGDVTPTILTSNIKSDESTTEVISPGVFKYSIRVPFVNPVGLPTTIDSIQGEIERTFVSGTTVSTTNAVPFGSGGFLFTDVEEGKQYRFRLRYVTNDGRTGPWTFWVVHTVVGKTSPPSDVTGIVAVKNLGGIDLNWNSCPDVDYSTTILKYAAITQQNPTPTWAAATQLVTAKANNWTWIDPDTGVYRLFLKHVDVSGNESSTAAYVDIDWTSNTLNSLAVDLTNPGAVSTNSTGANPVLTGTGTEVIVSQGGQVLKYDAVGTQAGRWKLQKSDSSSGITSGTVAGVVNTTTGDNSAVISDLTTFTASEFATVTYTITGKTTTNRAFSLTKVHRYNKIKGGAPGVGFVLSKPSHVFTTNSSGVPFSYTGASSTMTVLLGGADDTNNWTFSSSATSGITFNTSGDKNNTVNITNITDSTNFGSITITATRSGYSNLEAVFNISKSIAGLPGTAVASTSFSLDNYSWIFPVDSNGNVSTYTGASTTMKVLLGGVDDSTNWTYTTTISGVVITGTNTRSVSVIDLGGNTGYVDITASKSGYASQTLRFNLGRNGTNGTNGVNGVNGVNGNTYVLRIDGGNRTINYDGTGANPAPSTAGIYSVVLLENGVQVTPTSFTWSVAGHLTTSGSNTSSTYTPGLSTTFTSGLINLIQCDVIYNNTLFREVVPLVVTRTGSQGNPATPGVQSAQVYLYQWSTSQPGNPNGNTQYNWSGASNSTYGGTNNWSSSVPANPGTPNTYLWYAVKTITATAGAGATTVDWSTGVTVSALSLNGSNGGPGVPGTQTAEVIIYQWAATIAGLTALAGSATYLWSNGSVSSVPAGWSLTPTSPPSVGQTLWGASVRLQAAATATDSSITWTTAAISARGYSGTQGNPGARGSSYKTAYAVTTLNSLGTGNVTTTGETSLPPANSWGAAAWYSTPPALEVGQSLYQTDGIYDPITNNIVWNSPYLSSLRVGSLSAITANLGTVTAGEIKIQDGVAWIKADGSAIFKSIQILNSNNEVVLSSNSPLISTVNSTANAASVTANAAQTTADGAQNTADAAQLSADAAQDAADAAQLTATTAQSTANTANSELANKLAKNAEDILTGQITLQTTGLILAGTQNTGVYMGSGGLVGKKNGATTFAINAATGNATFSGTLSGAEGDFSGSVTATAGTIGGILINATSLRSSNYNATNNTGFLLNNGDGSAVFNTITARTGAIGGISINATQLFSSNYNSVTKTGFQLSDNGYAEFFNVSVRGEITASSGSITGTLGVSGHLYNGTYINGSTGTFGSTNTGNVGFYLGPDGLRIGNYGLQNSGSYGTGYFYVNQYGHISAPGLTIQDGNLTLTGTLTANTIISSSARLDSVSGSTLNTIATNAASVTNKLDKQSTYILGTNTAQNQIALKTAGYDAGSGLVITDTGILGIKNNETTFAIDNTGTATFKGTVTATSGSLGNLHLTDRLTGGNYTGVSWPAAGGNGFILYPGGLLMGSVNNSNGGYFEYYNGPEGYFSLGFGGVQKLLLNSNGLVIDGSGTFSGSLTAAGGTFKGSVNIGDYTDFGWPSGSGTGAHLGPSGLLLGNYASNAPYVQMSTIGYFVIGKNKVHALEFNPDAGTNGTLLIRGQLAVGGLDVGSGNIRGGKTAYNDNTAGFFLGNSDDTKVFNIGDGSKFLKWDGSSLLIQGASLDVKSATSGSRMEIKNDTIKVYDGTVLRVHIGNLAA